MRILLIISGSIALKKTPELIKKLNKKNIEIDFLITRSALSIIDSLKISVFKKFNFYTDEVQFKKNKKMLHIDLSRKCDAILVFPASANIIGKYANGIADDLASTTLLASNKPIFMAPAMNVEMWNNYANQNNVKKLKINGVNFIGPIYGNLSCGEIGFGRISDISIIAEEINMHFKNTKLLSGISGIVTSGPTIEPIDSTRFISNYSTGKQGYAIAKILSLMGAKIKLITGPSSMDKPNNVELIKVLTAKEMNEATMDLLPVDFAICTAAVADFKPINFKYLKIKKGSMNSISLKRTPDILYNISNSIKKRPSLVVGFAAETHNVKKNAKSKLIEKKCDWILANKISRNNSVFGSNNNSIHYITKNSYEKWPKMSKIQVAKKLNTNIIKFFENL